MEALSDLSDFQSPIEWPEMRPDIERATADLRPLAEITVSALDSLSLAWSIAPNCESPIETELAAQLCKILRTIERLSIQPQFSIDRYRYDFAIVDEFSGLPLALVECDGREFHETDERQANDKAKNELADKQNLLLFRFTGAEIYRDAPGCASAVFKKLQSRGFLTREEWCEILKILPAPRPHYVAPFETEGP